MLAFALAAIVIPAMACQPFGYGGVDIFGKGGGIFESEASAMEFPDYSDVNIDILNVGNDRALAIGPGIDPIATNNLLIKKNQDSGDCECCYGCQPQNGSMTADCMDCCYKVNIDQINVGDRDAIALGLSEATNNVKIVANQQ